jgi:two-component system LytT family response regulator
MKKLTKVFLVDDEPLALRRLAGQLQKTGRVEIAGQTTKPADALTLIPSLDLDALFLDIQMPELNGFELLRNLENHPPVVFVTAYDEFALEAFEVYSIDYLLKPVAASRLDQTLDKFERIKTEGRGRSSANVKKLLEKIEDNLRLTRLPSRLGDRVQIIPIDEVRLFYSEDKMTFAQNVQGKSLPVSYTLNQLEARLDKEVFLRVNRQLIVNINFIGEVRFGTRVTISLKDSNGKEIIVARERVKPLRKFLGL